MSRAAEISMSAARTDAAAGANVLYLSFDGMTDPLGRSQVLPYLIGLAELGHRIRIVSLEKAGAFPDDAADVRETCSRTGIGWSPQPYQQGLPVLSTLQNLAALRRAAAALHLTEPVDFVHCRSDLPALAGLALKRRFGVPLLYDMRAFWADERVEGGAWPLSNPIYRAMSAYFKAKQRELLAQADELVTLSENGRGAIAEMEVRPPDRPVTVIPCCADFELFAPPSESGRQEARSDLGVTGADPLLVHVGSIGSNCLLGEMLDFFRVFRERHPAARFLFVAPSGDEEIRAESSRREVEDAILVRSARREDVPRWIGAADLGIMFVRPGWAKRAASPTKLGEMLAMGLPVIANTGVGDVANVLEQSGAGVAVESFDDESYRSAMRALEALDKSPEEIRQGGRRWFDLELGVARYDGIYRRMHEANARRRESA
ncbi:MAG TPA: glycosyltransferase [Sphingomicrobium sp.]|nr:glycosyltransferase [Sphingomicrobium sp.]